MKSDEWETPQWLFDILNKQFSFDVDLCANEINHKCKVFTTNILQPIGRPKYEYMSNGFIEYVHPLGSENRPESAFMNPPYSDPGKFIKRALELKFKTLVMLLPVDTSTKWWQHMITATEWHKHIYSDKLSNINAMEFWFRFDSCYLVAHAPMEILFLPRHLKFEYQGKPNMTARFPSCLVIVRN